MLEDYIIIIMNLSSENFIHSFSVNSKIHTQHRYAMYGVQDLNYLYRFNFSFYNSKWYTPTIEAKQGFRYERKFNLKKIENLKATFDTSDERYRSLSFKQS